MGNENNIQDKKTENRNEKTVLEKVSLGNFWR